MDESQRAKLYRSSQATLQDLPSGTSYPHPGGQQQSPPNDPISRKLSRRNTGPSEPSTPLPADPQYDYEKLRKGQAGQVYGQTGGAIKSRTELQNTPGDRNKKDSRELSIRELAFVVHETGTVLDLNHDPDGDGEGMYWYDKQKPGRVSSRVLLFEVSPSPT